MYWFFVWPQKREIKRRTRAFVESEANYAELIHFAPDAVVTLDTAGAIQLVNPSATEMAGYDERELVGRNYADIGLFAPETLSRIKEELEGALVGATRPPFEIPIVRKDGAERQIEVHVRSIHRGGQIVGLEVISRDITERRRMEAERQILSRAVEQSASLVIITDADGYFQYVNPKFTEVTGYTMSELSGQTPRILKSGDQDPRTYQQLWSQLRSGAEWRGAFRNKKKDGTRFWAQVAICPIRDSSRRTTHYLAIEEDITEAKRIEQFKDEFIYIIPHELRTPLTVLRDGAEMFTAGALGHLDSEQQDVFKTMVANIDRMVRLVEKVELAEQLMLGRCEFAKQPMDFVRVVEEAAAGVSGAADAKNVKVEVAQGVISAPWVGDEDKLAEGLRELVDNAIRVSPAAGTVRLRCTAAPAGWQIQVADEGPGIGAEALSTLFDRLHSVGSLGERKTGGVGVGLFIAKGIIEAHGGQLVATSELGKGTCMTAMFKKTQDDRNDG